METLIIQNNNPNALPTLVLIVAIIVIVINLIIARIKLNKKARLEDVAKKIRNRHLQMIEAQEVKEAKLRHEVERNFNDSSL